MTAPKTTKVKVDASVAEATRTAATLTLSALPAPPTPVPGVQLSTLGVEAAFTDSGRLVADRGFGVSGHSTLRFPFTTGPFQLNPYLVATGATARFLPGPGSTDGKQWWAKGNRKGSYPKIQQRVFSSKGAAGPKLDTSYSWTYRGDRYTGQAWTYPGDGAADLYTNGGSPAATFVFVFVPHPGVANFWTLFANFSQATQTQVGIRVVTGRIDMMYEEGRLFSYETHMAAGEACILGLTLDGTAGRGRLALLDRRRGAVPFDLGAYTQVDAHSRLMAGAALGGGLDQLHGADVELLEVDYWNTAVPDTTLDGVMSNLAAVYGVSR